MATTTAGQKTPKFLMLATNVGTAQDILVRVERDTEGWLRSNGFDPKIACLYTEAVHLQGRQVTFNVLRGILTGRMEV